MLVGFRNLGKGEIAGYYERYELAVLPVGIQLKQIGRKRTMIDFKLTEEQRMLRDMCAKFV